MIHTDAEDFINMFNLLIHSLVSSDILLQNSLANTSCYNI